MRAKCIKFKRIKPKQLKSNLISIGCCNSKKKKPSEQLYHCKNKRSWNVFQTDVKGFSWNLDECFHTYVCTPFALKISLGNSIRNAFGGESCWLGLLIKFKFTFSHHRQLGQIFTLSGLGVQTWKIVESCNFTFY